jgi:phage terminase large subunit GpA-like protein
MTTTDRAFFRDMFDLLPDSVPPRLISEYVDGRRILPPSTPFPGYWQTSRTEFSREIMDDMSPYSPITHSVTMKARKLGITAAAEAVIGYWVDANPTAVEYVTATDELAEDWSTRRWEPLVDSMGFRNKIAAQVNSAKSRRTGDRTFKKQFMGGYLDIISAQSMAARRAGDIRVLVRDEIDGPRAKLSSGEGRWLEVNFAHTASWGARKKVMDFSSPTTFEASEINREYEAGDCRKFTVPCPFCGSKAPVGLSFPGGPTTQIESVRYQELVLCVDDMRHGLKGETEAGRLVRGYYVCEFCGEAIFNHQKTWMLARGFWQPTKQSCSSTYRSRQISSLYSPVGMFSWTDFYQKYLDSLNDPEAQRSFINLYQGMPYKEPGARPDMAIVLDHRGRYPEGEVQPGVLYLVMGCDVQRGSEKDPDNPPRIECEVLGIGAGYRTWSVTYLRFDGPIDDSHAGAWENLYEWAVKTGLKFKRADGVEFQVQLVLIDTGDAAYGMDEVIQQFCSRWQNTYPSKGAGLLRFDPKKDEKGDAVAAHDITRYRRTEIGESGEHMYIVSTNFYKRAFYSSIKIQQPEIGKNPPGYCDFPNSYTEEHFEQLNAEERRVDGSYHKVRNRNEALDCRIYAMCAGDIWLDNYIRQWQSVAVQAGARREEAKATIDKKWALAKLTAEIPAVKA